MTSFPPLPYHTKALCAPRTTPQQLQGCLQAVVLSLYVMENVASSLLRLLSRQQAKTD